MSPDARTELAAGPAACISKATSTFWVCPSPKSTMMVPKLTPGCNPAGLAVICKGKEACWADCGGAARAPESGLAESHPELETWTLNWSVLPPVLATVTDCVCDPPFCAAVNNSPAGATLP